MERYCCAHDDKLFGSPSLIEEKCPATRFDRGRLSLPRWVNFVVFPEEDHRETGCFHYPYDFCRRFPDYHSFKLGVVPAGMVPETAEFDDGFMWSVTDKSSLERYEALLHPFAKWCAEL